MNYKHVLQLIRAIRAAPPEKFNMSTWIFPMYSARTSVEVSELIRDHSCGTAACIGGWAQALAHRNGENIFVDRYIFSDHRAVAKFLGLSSDACHELCFGLGYHARASRDEALRVLQHLLTTRVVDWTIALGAQSTLTGVPCRVPAGRYCVSDERYEQVGDPDFQMSNH